MIAINYSLKKHMYKQVLALKNHHGLICHKRITETNNQTNFIPFFCFFDWHKIHRLGWHVVKINPINLLLLGVQQILLVPKCPVLNYPAPNSFGTQLSSTNCQTPNSPNTSPVLKCRVSKHSKYQTVKCWFVQQKIMLLPNCPVLNCPVPNSHTTKLSGTELSGWKFSC